MRVHGVDMNVMLSQVFLSYGDLSVVLLLLPGACGDDEGAGADDLGGGCGGHPELLPPTHPLQLQLQGESVHQD